PAERRALDGEPAAATGGRGAPDRLRLLAAVPSAADRAAALPLAGPRRGSIRALPVRHAVAPSPTVDRVAHRRGAAHRATGPSDRSPSRMERRRRRRLRRGRDLRGVVRGDRAGGAPPTTGRGALRPLLREARFHEPVPDGGPPAAARGRIRRVVRRRGTAGSRRAPPN